MVRERSVFYSAIMTNNMNVPVRERVKTDLTGAGNNSDQLGRTSRIHRRQPTALWIRSGRPNESTYRAAAPAAAAAHVHVHHPHGKVGAIEVELLLQSRGRWFHVPRSTVPYATRTAYPHTNSNRLSLSLLAYA